MPGALTWLYLVVILLAAVAGGARPFLSTEVARGRGEFPRGEAFAAGVFLALALTMMLPSSFHVFQKALPDLDYPLGSVLAIVAFLALLTLEHMGRHALEARGLSPDAPGASSSLPVIMVVMIAIPSFFLGAALGVSDSAEATLIFLAIILHKGTAAFALALALVRSPLPRRRAQWLFGLFVVSTPVGILVGAAAHDLVTGPALIGKGVVLALAGGTFLYLGTLHEMTRAPLIVHCCRRRCFLAMLAGLVLTAGVRLVMGEAHRFTAGG